MADRPFTGGPSQRAYYFDQVVQALSTQGNTLDVFLDPNTGLQRFPTSSANHVSYSEVARLTQLSFARLVIVYDQSRDRRHTEQVHRENLIARLKFYEIYTTVCSCGQVRMVICTKEEENLAEVKKRLGNLLGGAITEYVQ